MKTPDLPAIEYRPTFRLDSSGLVVGTATQEEWDAAVRAFNAPQPKLAGPWKLPTYPYVQCWRCNHIGHRSSMYSHVCSPAPVEKPAACAALENPQ